MCSTFIQMGASFLIFLLTDGGLRWVHLDRLILPRFVLEDKHAYTVHSLLSTSSPARSWADQTIQPEGLWQLAESNTPKLVMWALHLKCICNFVSIIIQIPPTVPQGSLLGGLLTHFGEAAECTSWNIKYQQVVIVKSSMQQCSSNRESYQAKSLKVEHVANLIIQIPF